MKMKSLKMMLAAVIAAAMCAAMTGCGENSGSSNTAESDSKTASDSVVEDSSADSTAAEQETQVMESNNNENDGAFEPSQDILDADLSSGLVQIGDDVFKNGGYMTINEFIDGYVDKYDVSSIDVDREVESGWQFMYNISRIDTGSEIWLQCCEPVSGDGVVGEGVIVGFYSPDDIVWYSSGISGTNSKEAKDITDYFEDNGCVASNLEEGDGILYERFPASDNIGKYASSETDSSVNIVAAIEIDDVNLYGETPKILYIYSNYQHEENNYFRMWDFYYKNNSRVAF